MLNSQPLGFYSSSQLIQDAQRHDVDVRPIDVTVSHWDAALEEWPEAIDGDTRTTPRQPVVRLGFNSVRSFGIGAATRLVGGADGPGVHVGRRSRTTGPAVDRSNSMRSRPPTRWPSVAGHRRLARWHAASHRLEKDLMQKHAGRRPDDRPAVRERRPRDRRRLREHRLHAATAPARAAAAATAATMRLQSAAELHDLPDADGWCGPPAS